MAQEEFRIYAEAYQQLTFEKFCPAMSTYQCAENRKPTQSIEGIHITNQNYLYNL